MNAGKRRRTNTNSFGSTRKEAHDSSAFYERFSAPVLSDDTTVAYSDKITATLRESPCFHGSSVSMDALADNSVALVVTSPPYFVGKDYELAVADSLHIPESYVEYLEMLGDVFSECKRVLEPGGRIAVNVANLGRKPYRSLSADVISLLQDRLGFLLRGEVIWQKSLSASGSCAWGSFTKASNPVLRDVTERVLVACKGSFSRARSATDRKAQGLPYESTLTNDEFMDATCDVWRIGPELASRVGHPAPFPVALPERLIHLYTYKGDIVLDPFMGSGSTLVAASRTGRIGVGYDIDSFSVELAKARLANEGAQQSGEYVSALVAAAKAKDIVGKLLADAGFTVETAKKYCVNSHGVVFDFFVTSQSGKSWWVEVAGSFTASLDGLHNPELFWKTLGRVQTTNFSENTPGVLLLTPTLPDAGSGLEKIFQSILGESEQLDCFEIYGADTEKQLFLLANEIQTNQI